MNEILSKLSGQLYEILETPVSIKILEQITEKQIDLLKMMIENIQKPNKSAFYYKSEEESRKTIYSILDYGKNKLKPREHSDKTKSYLQAKKLI